MHAWIMFWSKLLHLLLSLPVPSGPFLNKFSSYFHVFKKKKNPESLSFLFGLFGEDGRAVYLWVQHWGKVRKTELFQLGIRFSPPPSNDVTFWTHQRHNALSRSEPLWSSHFPKAHRLATVGHVDCATRGPGLKVGPDVSKPWKSPSWNWQE